MIPSSSFCDDFHCDSMGPNVGEMIKGALDTTFSLAGAFHRKTWCGELTRRDQ
jgi:hypothetical protein